MTNRDWMRIIAAAIGGAATLYLLLLCWGIWNIYVLLPAFKYLPHMFHTGKWLNATVSEVLVGLLVGMPAAVLLSRLLGGRYLLGGISFFSGLIATLVVSAVQVGGGSLILWALIQPVMMMFMCTVAFGLLIAARRKPQKLVER